MREMMLYHQQTTKMSSSAALGARNFDGHPCKLFSASKVVNDIHILPTGRPCFAEVNSTEKPVPPPRPRRLNSKIMARSKSLSEDTPVLLDVCPQQGKNEEVDNCDRNQTEIEEDVQSCVSKPAPDVVRSNFSCTNSLFKTNTSVPTAALSKQKSFSTRKFLADLQKKQSGSESESRGERLMTDIEQHSSVDPPNFRREPPACVSHGNYQSEGLDEASGPPPLPPRTNIQFCKSTDKPIVKEKLSLISDYARPNSNAGHLKDSVLRRSLHLRYSGFSSSFSQSVSQTPWRKSCIGSFGDSSTRASIPEVSVSSTSSVIYVNAEPVSDQDDAGVGDESTDCDRTLTETTTPLRHVHVEREGGESQELSVWIGSENGGSTPDVRRGSQSSTTDTVSTIESIKDVNEPDHVSEVVEKCNNEDSEPEENIYEVIQCPDSNVRASSPVTYSSAVPASQNHSSRTSPKNSTSDVSHDQSSNSVGMKQKLKENWNTTKKGWKRIRRRTIVPALADISKAIKVASSSSETSSYRDHEHRPVVSRPLSSGGSISSDMGGYSERSAFYLDLTPDSVSSDQRRMLTVDDPVVNLARCVEPLTHKFLDASDRSELNSDSSSDTIELDADERRAEQKKHRLTPVKTDGPYTQLKSRTRDSVTEYSVGSSTRSVPGSPRCSRFYTELPSNSSDGGVQSETEHRPTGSKKSLRCQRSVPNFTSSSRAALTSPPPVPDQPRPSSGPAYRPASASLTVSSSSGSSADAAFIGATSYLLNEEPLYQVYMRNQSGAIFDDGSVSSGSIYEEVGQLRSSPLNAGDCQVKPVTPVIEVSQSDGQRSLWSHLPEVINSGILDGLDSDERRLQEAVFELISSEASYIRSLRLLVSHFANDSVLSSHEDKHQTPAVISRHDHSVLFSNSTKVLECSESFLSELQQCLHEDIMMKNVSTILEKHASNHFDSYIQYCASQYLQDRKLEQLSESNQVFVENLSRLEAASCCQSLKLHSFLMLPMQRVTRLPLLVSATLCRLQENHPQFDGWQTAYRAVKQLAEKCNEEACKSQRLEELISISNKFVFKNMKTFPLANSNRSLVKKSSMIWTRAKVDDNKMTFGRKGSRQQVVNLFLFTDVLIITKKKSDGMYTVLDYCPRSMLQLSELDDKSDKFLLTLLCNHEEKTVELMMSCPAHSERLRWCEAINPTVQTENDEETVYQSWDCPQVCVHTAYVARDGDELALDPGDVIKVLRKLPDGWLQGEKLIGSKSGWFPSSCCTEIVSEHTRARNLRQRYKLLRVTANYLQQQQNRTTKSSKQPRSK